MQRKIYITGYKGFWLTAVYEDDVLVDLYADKPEDSGILDRIYLVEKRGRKNRGC